MLGVKEVKSIFREHNIRPSKRLGQNFLVEEGIQGKIIEAAELTKENIVLEIGPGLGALTNTLCECTKSVIAIEKDRRLYDLLLKSKKFSNLELICGDVLNYNFQKSGMSRDVKIKVVANLPYYMSSPILTRLLDNRDFISTIFITVQKEFAERLIAGPGSKTYGSISCFVQFYTEPAILFTIKKTAFYPAPKVDSCFLRIRIRDKGLYLTDEQKLFKIIRACFEKRRKTILNCLRSFGGHLSKEEILERLERAGISPIQRPETISLKRFTALTNIW